MIKERIRGMQHIGLPTNDMKATIAFYESLGFEIATRHINNGEDVVFLTLGNVCIETYENGQAVGIHGAIDHICLDVDDIEKTWEEAKALAEKMNTKRLITVYELLKDALDDASKNVGIAAITAGLGARIKLI